MHFTKCVDVRKALLTSAVYIYHNSGLAKCINAANHVTSMPFGMQGLYTSRKCLRSGHKLRPPFFDLICINPIWPPF